MRNALHGVMLGVCAMLAALPTGTLAQDYRFGGLRITAPVARATPPGAKTGAIYLTIDNGSNDIERLLRVSSPIAGGVAMHQMAFEDGLMKMRAIPSIEINPGGRLELKPDGYHLMLIDLKQPLKVGEKFPLMLTFERGGTIRVVVTVEEMGATPAKSR
ncbi:MAG TPA: copper chaperone PCu(A)C [Casimicrobiaceae bacterium]|nr:copper chaperone PCu(A)C [Casimicrobiaceae bacterium]